MRLMAFISGLAVVALLASPGYASDMGRAGAVDGMTSPSLYDRLGGKPAVIAVVNDLVERMTADKRIRWKFVFANVSRLTTMVVDHLCQAAGGPCSHPDRALPAVLADMAFTSEQFDVLVDDLKASLDKLRVGEREKAEVLSLVWHIKKDIVAGSRGTLAHTVSAQ